MATCKNGCNAPTINAKQECENCVSLRLHGKTVSERKQESIIKWKTKANGKRNKGKMDDVEKTTLPAFGVEKLPSFKPKKQIARRSEKNKELVKLELLVFQKIYNERAPYCEWCGTPITVFSPMNYHHLRTKGARPDLRLEPSNIVKICYACHQKEHSLKPKILD